MAMILNGDTGVQFNDSSLQGAAASPYVLKNRIINGDMRIDQRNAGASVTPTSGADTYTVDRFSAYVSQASKLTVQQNAGSVTPPVGFTNYLGVTSSSAYSITSSDWFTIGQRIEGFNCADLMWGTANAKTVTLSFWVRSSLTGTFGGSIRNGADNRSYPFTYTINSANTWEYETITIAGDTSGTWATNNTTCITIFLGLGVGSSNSGTAGSWAGASYGSATGATSVVGTNGATFYITGVQLEQNTSATPFERRLYNQELANCQRYCQVYTQETGSYTRLGIGAASSTTNVNTYFILPVKMRTIPSISLVSGAIVVYDGNTLTNATQAIAASATTSSIDIANAATGLTQTRTYQSIFNPSGQLNVTAEL